MVTVSALEAKIFPLFLTVDIQNTQHGVNLLSLSLSLILRIYKRPFLPFLNVKW